MGWVVDPYGNQIYVPDNPSEPIEVLIVNPGQMPSDAPGQQEQPPTGQPPGSGGGDGGGGGGGGGYSAYVPREFLEARARAIWEDMGCLGPIPPALLAEWISKGWLKSDDGILLVREAIKKTDQWWNGSVAQTERLLWEEDWEAKIGHPIDDHTRGWLEDLFRAGYSREQWRDWIETRPEYETGIEMAAMRQTYLDALYTAWGRGQVEDAVLAWASQRYPSRELDKLWAAGPERDRLIREYLDSEIIPRLGRGASYDVILDWARNQRQWRDGPEATATRENLRNLYTRIMRQAPNTRDLSDWVSEGWTPEQLMEYLRTTDDYQRLYAAKPVDMSEDEFNSMRDAFNAVGRWYFRGSGTLQTLTEDEVQALRDQLGITDDSLPPGVQLDEDGNYVTWDGAWEISDDQLRALLEAGWTPSEWEQHLRFTEQAIESLDQMNYLGEAIGRAYTQDEAYNYTTYGNGSGRMRAELAKAQHRRSFDTVFALLNGRMPTLEDYEYLDENFVSADHYYQAMTAEQDANAQFAAVDELLMRVYGYHADLQKLIDVNLNRPGSGAYEALIQAAEELDRYTLAFRLWAKRDPTPEDYAGFAEMAGPDELMKEIEVQEKMRSEGGKIRSAYDRFWTEQGVAPMTDDELRSYLGEYQGYGALEARLNLAMERRKLREQSVEMSLRWGAAISPIAYTEYGGPKLPGLKRIGG